jgi:hypothetical protein
VAVKDHFRNALSTLARYPVLRRTASSGPPLRASDEGLPRPRVARAKGVHQAIPALLTALSPGPYNLFTFPPATG